MAIIDVLKYEGSSNRLVWKWKPKDGGKRQTELRFGTQLIVNETQEVIFIKGGKILDVFTAGTYTLKTQNLPLLSSVIGLAFGGDSPFSAEVYFINKSVAMDIKWGITPFNIIEPNFKVPIPVTARGSFAVRVEKSKEFLTKIIGATYEFDSQSLQKLFRGVITEKVKGAISRISKEQNLNPLELEQIVGEVSTAVGVFIGEVFKKYGLRLELFNIEAIPIIDDDPKVQKIVTDFHRIMSEDMEERMRLKRRGESLNVYKTERTFDTTEKAAESLGKSGGIGSGGSDIMSTVVGMGMAMPIAGAMGTAMTQATQPLTQTLQSVQKCRKCNEEVANESKFCAHCGFSFKLEEIANSVEEEAVVACDKCKKIFPKSSKFCPHCGDSYNPCPQCEHDNPDTQKICFECDSVLPVRCDCGELNNAQSNFCNVCGKPLKKKCIKCNTTLDVLQDYCVECGTKTSENEL